MSRNYRNTSDSFDYLSTNNLNDFMITIKKFKPTTEEENMELLKRYRDGDIDALDELIKGNIRAIIHKAKAFSKNNQSYQLLDLINEAVIVFIEAADSYDLVNRPAKLATYFMNGADFKLISVLRKNDRLIRRSTSLSKLIIDYDRLIKRYEDEGKEKPNDETIKKELGISDARLQTVREDYKYQTQSLDARVNDDDDSDELSNFVSSNENISDDIVDKITNKELFIFLKRYLTDYQYYVLVMRSFGNQKYKDIAAVFGISESAIRLSEKKAHEAIKKVCSDKTSIDYKLSDDLSSIDIESMRCAPIHPYDIIRYMFFRDILTSDERYLFKLYIKGEYIPDDKLFARLMNLSDNAFQRIKKALFSKITNIPPDLVEVFNRFREDIIKKYGSKIYTIDWDMDLEDIRSNSKYMAVIWKDKTFDEVMESLKKNNITINMKMKTLLRRYFNDIGEQPSKVRLINAERDINRTLFGLKRQNEIPNAKLLQTLEDNRNRFDDEQYLYLLMRLNKVSRKEFIKKYPNTNLLDGNGYYLMNRLERLFFNIAYYKEPNFTKKKYFMIRDICIQSLSTEYVRMLDLYYGYKCKRHTVYDIERIFNISYESARDKLSKAKDSAMSIYLSRTQKRIIDSDYYIPYILNEDVDLNILHRNLLKGYLINKKTYDELSKEFSISKHDVSANILDALMKIDFYRFDILRKYRYPRNIQQRAIGSSKFSIEERRILQDIVSGLPRFEVETKYDISSKKLDNLLTKHTKLCHDISIEKVNVTTMDIDHELNIHHDANILNDNERIILAYTYGIKCDINPNGYIIKKEDFGQYYPNISCRYSKILKQALGTIAGKLSGIDRATMDIVDRDTLKRSLLDPRIPISQKERELLYYTYELNGYEYKTLDELASMYNDRASSIKRRIWRAVVTINRYENNEIQANISYEYDVEPNLKYFTKNDRNILISIYKKHLNYEDIAKEYHLTYSEVESLVRRLESYLRDILDDEINPFDFDYYYQVIDQDDLPFYDDLELAKEIFSLYYEERMSYSEIIEKLHLDLSPSLVQRILSSLMLAVLKRKEGIKRSNCYTYKDVIEYYKRNKDSMSPEQTESYFKYLHRVEETLSTNNLNNMRNILIPPYILMDLIKDNNENSFDFNRSTKRDSLDILIKYRKELTDETIETITSFYKIKGSEYMSSHDQRHVLKLLSEIKLYEEDYGCPSSDGPILSLEVF